MKKRNYEFPCKGSPFTPSYLSRLHACDDGRRGILKHNNMKIYKATTDSEDLVFIIKAENVFKALELANELYINGYDDGSDFLFENENIQELELEGEGEVLEIFNLECFL